MSLLQQYHAEHKARQLRLGAPPRYQARPARPLWIVPPRPRPEPAEVIREYRRESPSAFVPVARLILRAVAAEFHVSHADITSKSRVPDLALPRFVAMGLALHLTRMSYLAIGKWLGNRDHTTILHGKTRILAMLDESEAFRNRFDQIKASILSTIERRA